MCLVLLTSDACRWGGVSDHVTTMIGCYSGHMTGKLLIASSLPVTVLEARRVRDLGTALFTF